MRAEGRTPRKPPKWNAWTAEQRLRLRELAGSRSRLEVAEQLTREFGIKRSVHGISCEATRMGISLWKWGYSPLELAAIFGVSPEALVRAWVKPGLLRARRVPSPNQHLATYRIGDEAVAEFVRHCAWAYDGSRIRRGHRFALLAEVAQRADRWLTKAEVAATLRCTESSVYRYVEQGLIEARYRFGIGIVMRAADLTALRDAVNDIRARGSLKRAASIRRTRAAHRLQEREAA